MKLVKIKLLLLLSMILILFSCSELINEKDISNKSVELVAPVNNAQFISTGVTFTWNSIDNASGYQLQIARPDFTSPLEIVLDTTVSSSTTSFTKQLAIGQYQWRVRAINSVYQTPFTTRTITIASNDDFQNNTVLLVSPINNLITNTASQNLTWQSIIGATSYQLQIFDSTNTIQVDQNMSGTTYNYTFTEGSYQWKVRATNGTDTTLYSSRSILVDLTAPNTPTLLTPSNASTTTTTNVSFTWNRTSISGSTEKDHIYIYSDSALNNLLFESDVTSPYTKTLTAGTYYWRVKSYDLAGNTGTNSTTFNFTIN